MKFRIKVCACWLVLVLGMSSCATLAIFQPGRDSFDQGMTLFNQGNFRDALPYFQRATEEDPKFAQSYFYLGRSLINLRRWREAISPMRTAYRLAPEATQQEIADILFDALLAVAVGGVGPERLGSDPFRGLPLGKRCPRSKDKWPKGNDNARFADCGGIAKLRECRLGAV
jgi:tetratricopeptide (TPR) repeat protein